MKFSTAISQERTARVLAIPTIPSIIGSNQMRTGTRYLPNIEPVLRIVLGYPTFGGRASSESRTFLSTGF